LLIKLIDANDWLSVQVHPGDELARERHDSNGKTEMWYVLQALPGAELISGFSKRISKKEYIERVENKSIRDVLNFEKVTAGDVFYMPAGRVHALGPGLLIAEIQQSSDLTYRIYDWDRVNEKGELRQLHLDEALDAIDFMVPSSYRSFYTKAPDKTVNLVESPYFITNLVHYNIAVTKMLDELDSFVIYLCVEGGCKVVYNEGYEILKAGEALLIPAIIDKLTLIPEMDVKLLEIYIP
jgi:mannose-6-phosphate isomerase